MFALFKPIASPTEVGVGLLRAVDWELPLVQETMRATLSVLSDERIKMVVGRELIPLKAFTIDFGVTMTLEQEATIRDILGTFSMAFKDMAKNRPSPYSVDLITSRILDYRRALLAGRGEELVRAIGKAFAGNCGFPNSLKVMLVGIMEFTGTFQTVKKALTPINIQ